MSNHSWPKILDYVQKLYEALEHFNEEGEVSRKYDCDRVKLSFKSDTCHITTQVWADKTLINFVNPGTFGQRCECFDLSTVYQQFWYYRYLLKNRYPLVCPFTFGTFSHISRYIPEDNFHVTQKNLSEVTPQVGCDKYLLSDPEGKYWTLVESRTIAGQELKYVLSYKFGENMSVRQIDYSHSFD